MRRRWILILVLLPAAVAVAFPFWQSAYLQIGYEFHGKGSHGGSTPDLDLWVKRYGWLPGPRIVIRPQVCLSCQTQRHEDCSVSLDPSGHFRCIGND